MNKYQEALHFLSLEEDCNDTECKEYSIKKMCHKYSSINILQEAINKANKYDELQKVYFKNEPMESADLNGAKLQELYDLNSKLQEKETPKKPIKIRTDYMEAYCCPNCRHTFEDTCYCRFCGQRLDRSK